MSVTPLLSSVVAASLVVCATCCCSTIMKRSRSSDGADKRQCRGGGTDIRQYFIGNRLAGMILLLKMCRMRIASCCEILQAIFAGFVWVWERD